VEVGWYDWWKARGFFSPSVHGERRANTERKMEKKRFSMVFPPPNVTGVLHLGHALTATIQVRRGAISPKGKCSTLNKNFVSSDGLPTFAEDRNISNSCIHTKFCIFL
jgi:hypothetical protein